jgi:hypothetical protein
MQIPVAFAHKAVPLAGDEIYVSGGKRALTPVLEVPSVRLPDRVIKRIEQVPKILLHRLVDHLRGPKAALGGRRRNAGMKCTHGVGEGIDMSPLQRVRVEPMAEELVLCELTHFDRVLNGDTRVMKPWVFWRARDGHYR